MKELVTFLETHKELYDKILYLSRLENIIQNEQMRYLYLVSLISSDTIIDVESAKRSLEKLTFIKENMKYLNLDENLSKELKKYVNKGLKITKRDLKEFEKNGINN